MKKLLAIILVLVLALSAVACGKTETPAPDAGKTPATPGANQPTPAEGVTYETLDSVTGEVIRYSKGGATKAVKEDPTTLYVGQMLTIESGNPGSCSDTPLIAMLYDQFITIDYETGEYVGKVLKDWQFNDDCTEMTFTMRDDVVFHDGTKANAEDVLYSLSRYADGSVSTQSDRNVFGSIDFEKSEVTGEYTGKIAFKAPSISFVPGLTKAWILSKDYIESKGEDNAWWNNCMGSGKYKMESAIQGDRYNLVRNDNYWGGEKAAFEKVIIRSYAEASTMYIDFESGILDLIINPLSTDAKRIVDGSVDNSVLDIYSALQTFSVVFNEEMNPVLSDANVRKAIYLAIDPAVISKMAYDFLAAPADAIFADGVKDAYIRDHETDIEAAKKALADAGYKPGELTLVVGTNTQNVNMSMAEALQGQLEEAGFKIEICAVDPTTHITNFRNTGSDIYDMSFTKIDYGTLDSSPFLAGCSKACGSMSFTGITDDYVDEMTLKAKNASSAEEKSEALLDVQEYIFDNYWMVPIVKTKTAIIYKDYIEGIHVIQPRMPDLTSVKIAG